MWLVIEKWNLNDKAVKWRGFAKLSLLYLYYIYVILFISTFLGMW